MQIKAMAAMERGAELTPWRYEPEPLGPFDVLVEVLACGLCHSDIHMIDDAYGVSPIVEVFPMHEVNTAIEKVRSSSIRYRAVLVVG